jgi:hypothetical protein
MMTTIAIISGIVYLVSVIEWLLNPKNENTKPLVGVILILSTWSVLPLAITILCIVSIITLLNILTAIK